MAKQINPIFVFLIIIGAVLLYTKSGFFAITLQSDQVQYYNVPIEARFTSNLTNPEITAFFNDVLLFEIIPNESTQSIIYTRQIINGSYVLILNDVTQTGIFKFVATEGNISEIQVIEVRRPFVDLTNDIPNIVEAGTTDKFLLKTYTPQGQLLEADGIDITVYDPNNDQSTLTVTRKSANEFEANFNYEKAGNYQFKIRPRKANFDVKEFTVITSVTKAAGIHPVIWIWSGALFIFIILLVIRRFKR